MSNTINASRRPTTNTGPGCCPISLAAAPYFANAFTHQPHHQQSRQLGLLPIVSQNSVSMSRLAANTAPPQPLQPINNNNISNLTTSATNMAVAHQRQSVNVGRNVNVMQSDQLVQQQAHRQPPQPQTAPQSQPLFMAQAQNQVPTGPNYSNYLTNLQQPNLPPQTYPPPANTAHQNHLNSNSHSLQQQQQTTANCAPNPNSSNLLDSSRSNLIQQQPSRRPTSIQIPNANQTAQLQQQQQLTLLNANYLQQPQSQQQPQTTQTQGRNVYANDLGFVEYHQALLINQLLHCLPIPELTTISTIAALSARHLAAPVPPPPQQPPPLSQSTHPSQDRVSQEQPVEPYSGRQQHTSSVSHQASAPVPPPPVPPAFYPLQPTSQAPQPFVAEPLNAILNFIWANYTSRTDYNLIGRHSHHYHHSAQHHHHHLHASHHHHHHHHHGLNGQNGTQDDTMLNISESKPKGLNKAEIEHLSTFIQNNEKDARTCVICLCRFELKSRIRSLPCLHVFHAKCVDKWLRLNRTCPICRRDALKTHEAKTKRI